MITKEELLEAGYREYPPCRITQQYAQAAYQKCFRDNDAKHYFINFAYYEHSHCGELHKAWSVDTQFNLASNDVAFNVVYLCENDNTLEEVETFFKNVYERMECRPYETF